MLCNTAGRLAPVACSLAAAQASALPFFADGRTKPKPTPEIVNLPKFTWDEISAVEEIGRGSFGSVFTAKRNGKVVVVKEFWGTN